MQNQRQTTLLSAEFIIIVGPLILESTFIPQYEENFLLFKMFLNSVPFTYLFNWLKLHHDHTIFNPLGLTHSDADSKHDRLSLGVGGWGSPLDLRRCCAHSATRSSRGEGGLQGKGVMVKGRGLRGGEARLRAQFSPRRSPVTTHMALSLLQDSGAWQWQWHTTSRNKFCTIPNFTLLCPTASSRRQIQYSCKVLWLFSCCQF